MRWMLVVWAGLLPATALSAAEPDRAGVEFFEKKIRPVLAEHCYRCHSDEASKAKRLQGGLRLDTRSGLLQGGDSGPAIVPGDPAKSLLIRAIRHAGPKMPDEVTQLPAPVIADFEAWVKQGAPDPRVGPSQAASAVSDFEAARRSHWAFQSPRKHAPPPVKRADWPRGPIDQLMLAKLEANGLQPVAEATPRDLLRRVYFDLTGLPPTPEDVERFLVEANRDRQTALQNVVDRLLESPAYGERWGRHWLDVARYAEDQALAVSRENPHAFRYRDWVIQAIQRDMPYDQFLRLQLAGDLLTTPVDDYFVRYAGLGFQGLGQLYHRGNFTEQVMADELDDRIDTISRGLLGLTVACARCHDHKYDPVPTRDYYSLAAAYQGSNLVELPLAAPAEVQKHAQFVKETQRLEADLNTWLLEQSQRSTRAALRDLRPYLVAAWELHRRRTATQAVDESRVAAEQKLRPEYLVRWSRLLAERDLGKQRAPLAAWHQAVRDAVRQERRSPAASGDLPPAVLQATESLCREAKDLAAELDKLDQAHEAALSRASAAEKPKLMRPALPARWQSLATALYQHDTAPLFVAVKDLPALLDEAGKKQHQARLSELASFRKAGPPAPLMAHGVSGGGTPMKVHIRGNVARKGEDAPPGFLRVLRSSPNPQSRFNRLDLAEAIVARDNPLTARVIVNRVWQHHFGRGIVATPSNFGKLGAPPTHPELLDDLAVRFMEAGWSLKWLHRQILLSRTYQLSSALDEVGRARDPENQLLWRYPPRRLDFEAWRDAVLAVSGRLDGGRGGPSQPVDASTRRTVYSKISRSRLDPTLAVFDFPDANVSSEQRSVTTVAQQQLFVLNSQFMIAAAQAFAARLGTVPGEPQRISLAYRLAFSREPSAAELALGQRFLSAAAPDEKLTPWERYAQALLASNEFTWVP